MFVVPSSVNIPLMLICMKECWVLLVCNYVAVSWVWVSTFSVVSNFFNLLIF